MNEFILSIEELEHGWADLYLFLNGHDITLYFENIPNDPFCKLLESTMRIKDNRDSTIVFYNGSQKEYLSIKKLENGLCRIKYKYIYLDLPVKQFYKTILKMFDTYTFNFSIDKYNNNWSGFPKTELEELRNLYHTL